jgi:hypothetical protein
VSGGSVAIKVNDDVGRYFQTLKGLRQCNNPSFWKIEINGFIKIPNFGDNKNLYFYIQD